MKFSQNNTALFFINKNKGTFLTNKEPKGIELDFPKDILSNLEVIDRQKLEEFIHKFLEKNNISPSRLSMVLGEDSTFEKDITGISPEQLNSATQKFLDIIPFDETLHKTFKIQKKSKIYVVNKKLCKELSDVFGSEGFLIVAITPYSLLLQLDPKLKDNLPLLLKKLGTIKQYSLLNKSNKSSNADSSPINSRIIALVSIFVILIIILAILVFTKFLIPEPKIITPPIVKTPRIMSIPVATSEATPSAKTP